MGDSEGEEVSIIRELEKRNTKVTKLVMGDPSRYFEIQKNIKDAYNKAVNSGKTFYLDGPGLPELRDEVSNRYLKLYGIEAGKDKIIITQGVIEALQFLNYSIIYKNDNALLLAPFFTGYAPCVTLQEGRPLISNLKESDKWEIDIEDMERLLRISKPKYLLITTPNNPTGSILSKKSMEKIVEFGKNHDIFLVSDEIYDEIIYNGAKFTSLSKVATGVPHMILNGASKNYMATGFRIGFSIIPEEDKKSKELRDSFVKLSYSRLSANTPSQYAILEGLRNKKSHEKFIKGILPKIQTRSNLITNLINKTEYLTAIRPVGAFYVFAKIDFTKLDIKDDKEFVEKLLKEEHIQITKGSSFGFPGYVRIVSLPEEKIIYDVIRKIDEFCNRHKITTRTI